MLGVKLEVEQGELEGFTSTTANGFHYNSYLGIPFAKPPIGELRFKDPQLPERWRGTRSAKNFANRCSQLDMLFYSEMMYGSEDCLYLNVYAPTRNDGKKLAVMVWIHGGGFFIGSGESEIYGPDFLVENNVILVTVNYRLGPLGFLCLHTPEVPGNAGMKDQVFALRWVQKNIARFGGDPNNVTIFGESAGSASVQYLMLSDMSRSLFNKGVMQSGSCLGSWACIAYPEKVAFDLCAKLGLKATNKDELLKCLRAASVDDIIKMGTERVDFTGQLKFVPVIEKKFAGVEAFMTRSVEEVMKSEAYDPIPCICGVTSAEGFMFLLENFCVAPKFYSLNEKARYIETIAKIWLMKSEISKTTLKKVEDFYFPQGKDVVKGFVDIMSDAFFLQVVQSAEMFSKRCKNIYLYDFAYDGDTSWNKALMTFPHSGACHGDDLSYLFKMSFREFRNDNKYDVMTMKRMTSMWCNFAKYGNPTPKADDVNPKIWKPFNLQEQNCLVIDKQINLIPNPYMKRINFWKELVNAESQ